ncbi:MAG TPA: ABC transporter ATP-binding protein [Terracidiphilus sp.]|jgi:ABC-type glutathione transport system ATPase component|nr:ABC transporter ATP-binding protein [Terracidiphilus sp.]
MSGAPLIQVALDASYRGKPALRAIRFELQPGEVLGLVGTSGAGKSTLVQSLMGLLPWRGGTVHGKVLLHGENLLELSESRLRAYRGRKIALIPQSPTAALNPGISLERHFREAWNAHVTGNRSGCEARVRELLAKVQLPQDREFLRRRPGQISVGQAQRILIALALLHGPELIIADEPTSSLDPVTQAQIVELLRSLNRELGATLLYISHDLVSVLQLADRIAVLDGGTIVECLPVDGIAEAQHPATRALLQALPVPPEVLLQFHQNKHFGVGRDHLGSY